MTKAEVKGVRRWAMDRDSTSRSETSRSRHGLGKNRRHRHFVYSCHSSYDCLLVSAAAVVDWLVFDCFDLRPCPLASVWVRAWVRESGLEAEAEAGAASR